MKQQNLRQTKNALAQLTEGIAPSNREKAIAQNSPYPVEELQGAIGNRAVNQLLANQPIVQAKAMFRGLSEELRSQSPLQAKLAKEADSASVSEVQPKNKTGLPDNLKAGIENLSGMAMDDVRVHYNSSKPAQLQALAYTQGTDIHVAPGQEKHLPHEAWHVVQQKQRRVKPTIQAKDVGINDDEGLEKEADVMGAKAPQSELLRTVGRERTATRQTGNDPVQCVGWWDKLKKLKKKKRKLEIVLELSRPDTETALSHGYNPLPDYVTSLGDVEDKGVTDESQIDQNDDQITPEDVEDLLSKLRKITQVDELRDSGKNSGDTPASSHGYDEVPDYVTSSHYTSAFSHGYDLLPDHVTSIADNEGKGVTAESQIDQKDDQITPEDVEDLLSKLRKITQVKDNKLTDDNSITEAETITKAETITEAEMLNLLRSERKKLKNLAKIIIDLYEFNKDKKSEKDHQNYVEWIKKLEDEILDISKVIVALQSNDDREHSQPKNANYPYAKRLIPKYRQRESQRLRYKGKPVRGKTTYYIPLEELKNYEIGPLQNEASEVKIGYVNKKEKLPLDTMNAQEQTRSLTHRRSDVYIYAMSPQGNVYVADQGLMETEKRLSIHHSSFLGGKKVAAVGELKFVEGKLVEITDQSGHYEPELVYVYQALQQFEKWGITLKGVNVKLYYKQIENFFDIDAQDLIDFCKQNNVGNNIKADKTTLYEYVKKNNVQGAAADGGYYDGTNT